MHPIPNPFSSIHGSARLTSARHARSTIPPPCLRDTPRTMCGPSPGHRPARITGAGEPAAPPGPTDSHAQPEPPETDDPCVTPPRPAPARPAYRSDRLGPVMPWPTIPLRPPGRRYIRPGRMPNPPALPAHTIRGGPRSRPDATARTAQPRWRSASASGKYARVGPAMAG